MVTIDFRPEFETVSSLSQIRLTFSAQITAPALEEDETFRAPVSLSAVLDKSGSMEGTKLELVMVMQSEVAFVKFKSR